MRTGVVGDIRQPGSYWPQSPTISPGGDLHAIGDQLGEQLLDGGVGALTSSLASNMY